MADETLSYDIIGRDAGASTAFRRVADSATLAARGARLAAIALEQQRKTADVSAGATLALARADKILAEEERSVADQAAKADVAMRAMDKAARGGIGGRGPGGSSKGFFDRGLAGGIGPGILGISAKWASIFAGGAAGLGALPAASAIAAALGVAGIGAKTLIGSKLNQGPLYASFKKATSSFTDAFQQAAKGLEKPLRAVFQQIPKFIHQITPELKNLFAAVGPLLGPLLHAFEGLIKGLLPGLIALLRAARPALSAFAGILATVGKDIGAMFKSFAPAIRASSLIFRALADVLAGLFPIVGKLAAIMARTLAPIFRVLANAIKALEPTLVLIGRIIADFAKAVLGDLAAAFKAIATLLKDIAPALNVLGRALGRVFTVMENSGVFAILGNALERLAPMLAKLINAFVIGLAPILPVILKAVSQVAGALTGALVKAIAAMIPGLTKFIVLFDKTLREMTPLIPVLVKVNLALIQMLVKAIVPLLPGVTKFLDLLIKIQSRTAPVVIKLIIAMTNALLPAIQAFTNIVGAISTFIGWLLTVISKLQNFKGVWRTVTDFLKSSWSSAWNAIKTAATNAWHWIESNVINPLKSAYNFLKSVWGFLTGSSSGGTTSAPTSPSGAMRYAQSQLASHGFNPRTEWVPLYNLWQRESGWNRLARNASGAYGIPQGLPASKMGPAANPPISSAIAQINWGLSYIKGRYGSPTAAWNFELNHGWYDKGGLLKPGLTLALNTTGRPEMVVPASHQGSRSGGGNTFNINVHVPPTANKTEIAREIADVLNHGAARGIKLRNSILAASG